MENIFLIGFMGSGKSTIGKNLAKELNKKFIDLDDYIVKEEGKSISKIFEKVGEEGFRKIENSAIKSIIKTNNQIIATGGGAPCFYDNMEIMNKNGKTVFLKLPAEELAKRLANEKAHRPLIANLTNEELLQFIETKLNERDKYYEKAKIITSSMSTDINFYIKAIKA